MKKQISMFMKKSSVLILLFVMTLMGCKESEYTKLVKSEMAKEFDNDSLFLAMEFGIEKQEFFDRCWKLNKEGTIQQGPKNNFAKYELKNNEDRTKHISMLFYGVFNDEKIMTGLDLKFYYEAWSLWNKSLHSDKLINVVSDSLESWFPGNNFIKMTMKDNKEVLIKVDGYRRILIESLPDTREVDARIDDLRYIID